MSQLSYRSSAQVQAIQALHEELGDSADEAGIGYRLPGQAPRSLAEVTRAAAIEPDPAVFRLSQAMRLLPWKTVLHNVARDMPCGPESQQQARQLLSEVGLAALSQRWLASLTREQRWRVAFARLLACQPERVVCDLIFSDLDSLSRQGLRDLLQQVCLTRGIALLVLNQAEADSVLLAESVIGLPHEELPVPASARLASPLMRGNLVLADLGLRPALPFSFAV